MIDSQRKALIAAQAALEKHAEGVVVLDLRALSSVTDFFVICTAGSAPQVTAIRDHVEHLLAQRGASVFHVEGVGGAPRAAVSELRWTLMDCGDVVVHVMDERARDLYRLEDLWADAPRVPVAETPLLPRSGRDLPSPP